MSTATRSGSTGLTPERRARRPRAAIVVAVVAVAAIATAGVYQAVVWRRPSGTRASDTFVRRYVAPDGRVVRHDQGRDTVSEGQTYALLIAVATDDAELFDRVWSWTTEHLQRGDGLLSWHWKDGKVDDDQPAADADLDAARALLLAGERFDREDYTAEGRRIAGAILANEVHRYGDRTVVVAGPWARERSFVNPSYLAPRNYADLRTATRDARWDAVAEGSAAVLRDLMQDGSLPPDWARMRPDGSPEAVAAPDAQGSEPGYGLDAPRTFLRLAESCDDDLRELAGDAAPSAIERAEDATHPTTIVGAAAAAHAGGDTDRGDALLDRAEAMAERHPSYYGWALVALGRIVLQSDALGACP